MAELAAAVGTTPHSGIRTMADRARRVPDAIRLEAGDPNFTTPSHIIEAAAQAARDGFTKYTPSAGLDSLRELLADKLRVKNGLACSPAEVVVTSGGCGGLYTSLLILLDPGDEVLVPDPGWANYPAIVHVLNGVSVGYPLDRKRGFEPDLDALEARITPRTKAILVNSPGNPTGAVFRRETLAGLLEVAGRHDLWVVSDECYEDMVFEGEHVSPAAMDEFERVIGVFSFSKSYAMTGWRIGYAVAPPVTAPALARAQEPVVGNASSLSQKGAEAALLGPQDCVDEMREAYRERRDLAMAILDAAGVGYVRSGGAFYLMVDVPGESLPFAVRLLEEERVSAVPGSAFGPGGEGMVRVSLCVASDELEEGVRRLAAAVRRWA